MIPRVLFIDDQISQPHSDQLLSYCVRLGLRWLDSDQVVEHKVSKRIKNVLAEAEFCTGQELLPDGGTRNSIDVVREAVVRGWNEDVRRWSLIFIDGAFIDSEGGDSSGFFGLQIRDYLHKTFPGLPLVMLSAHHEGRIDRQGKIPYVPKLGGLSSERIGNALFRLTLLQNARNLTVRNKRELLGLPKNVICADDAMIDVYAQALKAAIANKEPNVLIYGQSGAGKQALAEYIHVNSERCTTRIADGKPSESDGFYRLDCGAESDTILEETLFGHRKGTFTGADDNRGGRFEAAHKGTIFLDELQNSSEKLQQRFLGVIQNGKLFRQGEHELRDVDLRFIAAANEPLDKLVSSKKLREDLYHRLRQIQIDIPPLAQRKADIIPLARHFLQNSEITDEALDALAQFDFPGNVRQLESIIGEMVTSKGSDQALIKIQDLPSEVIDYLRRGHVVSPPPQELETQPDSRDVRPDGPGASPAIAVANDPQAAAVARIIQIAMDGGTYSDLKESELRELDQALEGEVLTIFGHLVLWSCYRRADVTNAAKYLGLDREAANSKAVSLVKNVFKLPHVAEPMEVAGHQLVPEDSKLWDKLREARRTVSGAKERGQKK